MRRNAHPFRPGSYFLLLALLTVGLPAVGLAESGEWTRFRGPDGSGIGHGKTIPMPFTAKDIVFDVVLPGSGSSSPVLWDGRLFVTCALEKERTRRVLCFDAATGQQQWSWQGTFEPYRQNRLNSYAASTPAVDARHVYLSWVSGERFIVLALDHEGHLVWRRDLGRFRALHGAGGSPIVFDDVVIAGNDNASGDSFLIGLDAATGKTRWRLDRRSRQASYITPVVYRPKGAPAEVIFLSPPHGISGVDPLTGRSQWEIPGPFTLKSVASPVIAGDLIFATAGRGGGGVQSAAVRPGKDAAVVYELKADLPYIPTPIVVGKYLFLLSDRGVATCVEAATGTRLWRQALGGRYYASPVALDDKLICVSRAGKVSVLAATSTYALLGTCKLPEGTDATPAIADGRIYFRTHRHVLAVAPPRKPRSRTP